jgi:hypothetical protein
MSRLYIPSDIIGVVTALALANARAMGWAREWGADRRDVAIARTAYQAALADVAVAFGLARTEVLVILGDCAKIEKGGGK